MVVVYYIYSLGANNKWATCIFVVRIGIHVYSSLHDDAFPKSTPNKKKKKKKKDIQVTDRCCKTLFWCID